MFRKAFFYWAACCQGESIDHSKRKKNNQKMRKGAVRKEDIWS